MILNRQISNAGEAPHTSGTVTSSGSSGTYSPITVSDIPFEPVVCILRTESTSLTPSTSTKVTNAIFFAVAGDDQVCYCNGTGQQTSAYRNYVEVNCAITVTKSGSGSSWMLSFSQAPTPAGTSWLYDVWG